MLTLVQSVALALLLLLTQHAGLHHAALIETNAHAAHGSDERQADFDEPCETCQVFAQLANPLSAAGTSAGLRGDLSFELPTAQPANAWWATSPAERSRGPPVHL